ncbi:porin [Sulfitobacter sp. HNIBRBA3233]|uniref:porin n=1 Tax=Sulfitobacter marinivivus TaxID=3158558 RepID=UPI0032DF9E91
MLRKILLTTILCGSASAAAAELTYGAAFAKYHDIDAGSAGSADVKTFGGAAEYRTGNLTFSGELGRVDIEGIDLDFATLGVGYTLANGITLGLDHAEFDLLGDDAGVTSVYAMYSVLNYTLGLSIGEASELDETVYSVFGAWDVTEGGTVGLDIVQIDGDTLFAGYADYDLSQYSVQADLLSSDGLDLFGVAGKYELGNGFAVIASLGAFDLDGLGGKAVNIGAQYEFTPGANVELALGRIDVDGADTIDQATFGVSYELGRRTSQRRSVANIFSGATGSVIGLTDF